MSPDPTHPSLPALPDAVRLAAGGLLLAALERAPVAMLLLSSSGRVLYAGGQGLAFAAESLVGTNVLDLEQTDDQRAQVLRALAGESLSGPSFWGGRHWQVDYVPVQQNGAAHTVVVVCHDVTEQVLARDAAAEDGRRARAVLDTADEAIVVLDLHGRVTSTNAAAGWLLPRVRPGVLVSELVDGLALTELEGQLRRRAEGHRDRYQMRAQAADGRTVWLQVAANPFLGHDGEVLGSVAVLTDITETKEQELQQAALARTDALTGVASRLTLTDRLEHVFARRDAGPVAVLFCDVDGLKEVNDRFGHAAGDELLQHVSRSITGALRPADTVARYGGDEFVVVCEDLHEPQEARLLADRIIAAVMSTGGDPRHAAALCIGIATSPPHADAQSLLAAADRALYLAKRAGRGSVRQSDTPV